ncbi:hypothetical protein PsYK624_128210 [Phanerochaete sordida]|uniref:Uncharacterized protein n=1 Tax=Phanerochaete sordida TaxID=48140 RepID=A0A9P3GKG3_9APHY|nr:hypothetical protein PsYK624_128210 [Phanerochaete sordida]
MCYTPVNSAETNDPEHSVEEEFKPATGSTPESRVPSSLLDSSTSHMAVYDDPYGAIEHLSPPPAVRVPPMPPLPSHILEGRTLLNKYKTLRQARRARQSADHEARKPSKRYATDGGVCLSGGRTSAQTIATIGSAQSKRSEDTVQTCSTMPPPYGVYS